MSFLSHSMTCRSSMRGRLDRDQFVETVLRQHEPARMLREMARRADQLRGRVEGSAEARIVEIEVELLRLRARSTPSVLQPQTEARRARR